LITGGLGFLGLAIARWLVRRDAAHLVLAGRGEPSPEARACIAELEKMGAEILVVRADVAERRDLAGLLERTAERMPPLRGIFHAAGIAGRQAVEDIDLPSLRSVLRAKVAGTWWLDRLTRGLALDCFVCFSSIASLWGSKGQAHYAAANHFLDAFAHERRARGLPALTVNWGPWSGGGIASAEDRDLLERMGIAALSARQNLAALARLLASDVRQAAVVKVAWPLFKDLHAGRSRSRLFEHIDSVAVGSAGSEPPAQPPLVRRLREAGAGQRRGLFVAHLQEEAARILGFAEGRLPDAHEGFFQLGMDSLMAVELRDRLVQALGQPFPAALVFDFPTIEGLAGALLDHLAWEPAETTLRQDPARPAARKVQGREPIAIVGMACRFPGGADDPDRFWQLLAEGRDAIRRIPAERWDADAYYDPAGKALGAAYTQRGGFIDDVDLFDAGYFGISPREATAMDPQQRLLLELGHAALENAGQPFRAGAGERTGVFVGLSNNEYAHLLLADAGPERIGPYHVTGNALNAAAGRLSYALGLRGPSLTVDTACSSSLVAVHLACRSLWDGESDRALAAGANLILTPAGMVAACQAHMLSADGRCKTFDASADGYGRGEGVGVVVLKRLSDALAAGDRVWALIRGSAVNQDGRSSGFTVPNGPAQQAVIRAALDSAELRPEQVGYVEAHGTGTALGDPIEVGALGAVFGADGARGEPLLVGSVKANIGHLESAAGIAGLIKTALVLRHGEIPRLPHLRTPNPEIAWDRLAVTAAGEHRPWPGSGRRIAGVSSFGVSGTNAHLVLEEAPEPAPAEPADERPLHLLTLSARSPETLRQLAGDWAAQLEAHPAWSVADVCFTANARRPHPHRAAWAVASLDDARNGLRALAERDAPLAGDGSDDEAASAPLKIAFLFGGQDAAHLGMGHELYATQPVFRGSIDKIEALLRPLLPRSLSDVLFGGDAGWLDDAAWIWPATFALEYALAELWRAWGVEANLVLGQGVGEYTAACVAGAFGLEDGLRLCVERGSCEQRSAEVGDRVAFAAAQVAYAAPRLGFVSAVSGEVEGAEIANARYWRRRAANPERLAAALAAMRREGCGAFLDLGPKPLLLDAARQALPDADALWLPGLAQGSSPWPGLVDSLAALYLKGVAVDLCGFDRGYGRRV
ncbi:MAG: type I polyketide synthase, partial [Gammaproteobacteria bacterium]